jgi:hypothetical protein
MVSVERQLCRRSQEPRLAQGSVNTFKKLASVSATALFLHAEVVPPPPRDKGWFGGVFSFLDNRQIRERGMTSTEGHETPSLAHQSAFSASSATDNEQAQAAQGLLFQTMPSFSVELKDVSELPASTFKLDIPKRRII